jgi:hypothetical protein
MSSHQPPRRIHTRQELLAAGVSSAAIAAARRRGALVSLQRGVYCGPGVAPPLERARAALLAVDEPGSAASHHTAARVHGVELPSDSAPVEHITIPRAERRPHRPTLRLHTARLPELDLEVREGVPLTGLARTLVDLARVLPEADAVWAVERALAKGRVTQADLEASARRLARAPGILRARARYRAARELSGSLLETKARLIIVAAGLPEPTLQLPVVRPGGRRALLDMAYEEHRVGIEMDGEGLHGLPEAVYSDRWRQNDVNIEGWTILRFTWRDLYHRRRIMIDTVARALNAYPAATPA